MGGQGGPHRFWVITKPYLNPRGQIVPLHYHLPIRLYVASYVPVSTTYYSKGTN